MLQVENQDFYPLFRMPGVVKPYMSIVRSLVIVTLFSIKIMFLQIGCLCISIKILFNNLCIAVFLWLFCTFNSKWQFKNPIKSLSYCKSANFRLLLKLFSIHTSLCGLPLNYGCTLHPLLREFFIFVFSLCLISCINQNLTGLFSKTTNHFFLQVFP